MEDLARKMAAVRGRRFCTIVLAWLPASRLRVQRKASLEDARRLAQGYAGHYNNFRLNSAIGYITPNDMLAGRQHEIHAERDRKLEMARKQRQIRRQQAA